jgi:tetratricopeptide (TPR) repeat protein
MASVSTLETASAGKFPARPETRQKAAAAVTISDVRRTVAAVTIVAIAGVAGALAFGALANEREFDRLIAVGDAALATERPFEAIEAYSGAIARKPDSMLAHYKRGAVYQSQSELEAALRDFRSAADIDPSSLRALEALGVVNVALGRHERAVERYLAFTSLDDRNARVLYKLGLARYRAGQAKQAMSALQQALSIDPAMGEAYYVLGLAQRDLNQLAGARKSLEEAARRSPASQTAAREALADVYLLDGDHGKAINQLEALAALEPTRADRVVAVGLAQARAGRDDAAVTTLSRAVERFPDAPQVYAAIGHVWLVEAQRRGDRVALHKAVEALQDAANRADSASDTYAELGRAWLLAGDRQAAERALRQAIAKLPVPPDAFLMLAEVTSRDGRIHDARDALLRYATLVGDEKPLATVATRIADYSVRLGEPALAVRWFDRAIDDGGPSPALQVKLAEAALGAGDVTRAHQVVDEGLAAEPGNRSLQQLKQRLPQ